MGTIDFYFLKEGHEIWGGSQKESSSSPFPFEKRFWGFFFPSSQLFVVVASSSSKHQGLWVLTSFGQQVIYFDFVDNHRFWFFLSMHFSSNNCWFTDGYLILIFFSKMWEPWVCIGIGSLGFFFENRGWWTLRTALISVKVLFLRPVLLGTYLVFINNLWFWFLRKFWNQRTAGSDHLENFKN